MNKIYWVTDMNTEDCYEGNVESLVADLASVFSISNDEARETLSNLDEDETIQFTQSGKLYEVDVEVIE